MLDIISLHNTLTDYADEFGDQDLLGEIEVWKQKKLGTKTTKPFNLLPQLIHKIRKLDKGTSLDYTRAITDSMWVIMEELIKS